MGGVKLQHATSPLDVIKFYTLNPLKNDFFGGKLQLLILSLNHIIEHHVLILNVTLTLTPVIPFKLNCL